MSEEFLRSHVERCLQDIWNVCRARRDADGDYPFRRGTAAGYVRVEDGEPPLVRVFAYAALSVPRSPKVLKEINDINTRSRTAHVYWDGGVVHVEHALLASTVGRESLQHACAQVGRVADSVGSLVAGVYGGETPYPVESAPVEEKG